MSKRVTLTKAEVKFILSYIQTELPYAEQGQRRGIFALEGLKRLQAKLESQHPRSVKTLGVSGNRDKPSVSQENK